MAEVMVKLHGEIAVTICSDFKAEENKKPSNEEKPGDTEKPNDTENPENSGSTISPETGDHSNITFYFALMLISALALAVILLKRAKQTS